jgi:predicted metal-binding membrane protein
LLGIHHGIFCIGCCWALMLLMFAVGTGSIAWMLVLGGIMAVEKNATWGRRLSMPLGVFLIGLGIILGLGPEIGGLEVHPH